jgi:hypothetical protein
MPVRLLLPALPRLSRNPELAALAILDASLDASVWALASAHPTGSLDSSFPRRSPVRRAKAIVLQCRRLAATIAGYRDDLERENGRRYDEPF